MSNERPLDSSREKRLEHVLATCLQAEEKGQSVDLHQLIEQHPDLKEDLISFFHNRSAMRRMAGQLQPFDLPTLDSPGASGSATAGDLVHYFGDYELLGEIARGGMGVVYRARQKSLNRIVALKLILAGSLASELDLVRFRAEAESAANLDHPGIVPIYEVGEHEGKHYYSMGYLPGGSLAAQIPILKQDPRRAVTLLVQVCRAVHFAHQRGIVHRDLKPANILLDLDGTAHVADFGLARHVNVESHRTLTGTILGTPSYMAPEQAQATPLLTTGVDVYALGAILYEMLVGQPPFREATPLATLQKVLSQEPIAPRQLVPSTDIDLETIALRCLEKEPDKRYQSAAELGDELERWLRGEPIHARPVSLLEKSWKWMKRQPMTAGLVGTAMLCALLVAVGLPIIRLREKWYQQAIDARSHQLKMETKRASDLAAQADLEKTERTKADAARAIAQTEGDAQKLQALQNSMETKFRTLQAIRMGQERGSPDQILTLVKETAELHQPLHEVATRLGADSQQQVATYWNTLLPKLNYEAVEALTNPCLRLDKSVTLAPVLVDNNSAPGQPSSNAMRARSVSADGKWLARPVFAAKEPGKLAVEIVSLDNGGIQQTHMLNTGSMGVNSRISPNSVTPCFMPNGQLLIGYLEHDVGPNESHKLFIETRDVPSGEQVASVSTELIDEYPVPPETKGIIFPERPVARELWSAVLVFSPDGKQVSVFNPCVDGFQQSQSDPQPTGVFDVSTGKLVEKFVTRKFCWLSVTSSGRKLIGAQRVALKNDPNETIQFLLGDISKKEVKSVPDQEKRPATWPHYVAVSPDERWLVYSQGSNLLVRDLENGHTTSMPIYGSQLYQDSATSLRNGLYWRAVFRPDGRLLAVATTQQIYLISVPEFRVLHRLPHGLNPLEQRKLFQEASLTVPVSMHFLADGRLAIGFTPHGSFGAKEEVWQVWYAKESKVDSTLTYRAFPAGSSASSPTRSYVPTIPQPKPRRTVARFVGSDSSKALALLPTGFGLIDFTQEKMSIYQGQQDPETIWQYATPWTRTTDKGPQWLPRRIFTTGNRSFVYAEADKASFDGSGRWFLRNEDVWDTTSGQLHRSFSGQRLLAHSPDERLLAVQAESVGSPQQDGRKEPIRVWDIIADREVCQFETAKWLGYGCDFTADSQYLIGYGDERGIVIGRVRDGLVLGPVKGHYSPYSPYSGPVDPSGKTLLVKDQEKHSDPYQPATDVYRVINLEDAQVVHSFPDSGITPLPAYSSDGEWLLWGEHKMDQLGKLESASVKFWSSTEKTREPLKLSCLPFTLRVAMKGERLLVSGVTGKFDMDQWLEIWDLRTGKQIATTSATKGAEFDYYVAEEAGTVALWSRYQSPGEPGSSVHFELRDLQTGKVIVRFPNCRAVAEAGNGKLLLLEDEQRRLRAIDAATGKIHMESTKPHEGFVVSPDSMRVLVQSESALWSLVDASRIRLSEPMDQTIDTTPEARTYEANGPIPHDQIRALFTPDSQHLITYKQALNSLAVWNVADGQKTKSIELSDSHTLPNGFVDLGQPTWGHAGLGWTMPVQVSADSQTVAVNICGAVSLFRLESGERIVSFVRSGHASDVTNLSVSPNGRYCATAGNDHTVGLWLAADGKPVAMLNGYAESLCAAEFSSDSQYLLTRENSGHLALWRIEASSDQEPKVSFVWQRSGPKPNQEGQALAISPDGLQFACASPNGTILIASLENGRDVKRLAAAGSASVVCLSYTDAAKSIAAGFSDGTVRLWNSQGDPQPANVPIARGEVRSLTCHADHDLLVAASQDLCFLQRETGRPVFVDSALDRPLIDAHFSHDGSYLLTTDEDHVVRRIHISQVNSALKELGVGW